MSLVTLRSFFRALLGRARMEREMDSELRFHLGARIEDLIAGGLDRAAAQEQAHREPGEIERRWMGNQPRRRIWICFVRGLPHCPT
jgi:hypothetical protein